MSLHSWGAYAQRNTDDHPPRIRQRFSKTRVYYVRQKHAFDLSDEVLTQKSLRRIFFKSVWPKKLTI